MSNLEMSRPALLALALAGILGGAALAQDSRYENPELHYSLTLPEGWERIPQDEVQAKARRLAEETATPVQDYVAGFQRHAKRWFAQPYVLLMHRKAIGDHTNLATVAYGMRQEIAQVNGRRHDAALNRLAGQSDYRLGEPYVVPQGQLIVVPTSQEVAGVGRIQGLMVLKPGKEGTVQLNFYARAKDFEPDRGPPFE